MSSYVLNSPTEWVPVNGEAAALRSPVFLRRSDHFFYSSGYFRISMMLLSLDVSRGP